MKVLVVGSGGREHALAWCLARSSEVSEVLVTPGNPGTDLEVGVRNVPLDFSDFSKLADLVEDEKVDLTIVGPEQPISEGIRDYFDQRGLKSLAPTKAAGRLESSKSYAKAFMQRHDIPTARALVTQNLNTASDYIRNHSLPIVIKADGLAAGKGVTVASSVTEAMQAVEGMLSGTSFGEAGRTVVIEDFLEGEEASFTVLSDGQTVVPFATSQDHKPVFNGDEGPNTGGMGAYSPAPVVTAPIYKAVMDRVVLPTIEGMAKEGNPFQGFLYVGLMIHGQDVNVVEYNCRFGDPEAQPVLMRLKSDLASLCMHAVDGGLANEKLEFDNRSAVAVVLASGGYPGNYEVGYSIGGLQADDDSSKVFHAGTALKNDEIVTNGGRVLAVTALGDSVTHARNRAYERAKSIRWRNAHMRTDIAYRAIERESQEDSLNF